MFYFFGQTGNGLNLQNVSILSRTDSLLNIY